MRGMENHLKVLFVAADSGFYRIKRYPLGDFFGPVDLGLHLAGRYNSLNIGAGLLAGSILPGSNRLIFTGFSPCWGGFYVSTMGGAALVFDNLGINMVSLVGKAPTPSILFLNRTHGEEIEVRIEPVDIHGSGARTGRCMPLWIMSTAQSAEKFKTSPRILPVGPAAEATDFGAIARSRSRPAN